MLRGRSAGIAAALAIATLAAVAAGCGGGSGGPALSLDPVAAAATKTEQAGAARIRFSMTLSGPQMHAKTVRVHGTGAIDGSNAEMSFNLGSMLKQMNLPASASSVAGALFHNSSMKAIVLDQNGDYVIYMRIPFLSAELPGGKAWMKMDISKLGKSAGIDMSKVLSGSQLAPSDLLSMLKAEGATVHTIGHATIDGTATTQYNVKIEAAKVLKSSGLTSPVFAGVAAKLKSISENVWIDKNGLVRRVAFSYGLPVAGSPHMAMTMDLSDYGAHVTIAAPPSSQVVDMTQLAKQGLGNFGG